MAKRVEAEARERAAEAQETFHQAQQFAEGVLASATAAEKEAAKKAEQAKEEAEAKREEAEAAERKRFEEEERLRTVEAAKFAEEQKRLQAEEKAELARQAAEEAERRKALADSLGDNWLTGRATRQGRERMKSYENRIAVLQEQNKSERNRGHERVKGLQEQIKSLERQLEGAEKGKQEAEQAEAAMRSRLVSQANVAEELRRELRAALAQNERLTNDSHRQQEYHDDVVAAHAAELTKVKKEARRTGFDRGAAWVVGVFKKLIGLDRLRSSIPSSSWTERLLMAPDRRAAEDIQRHGDAAILARDKGLPSAAPSLDEWLQEDVGRPAGVPAPSESQVVWR